VLVGSAFGLVMQTRRSQLGKTARPAHAFAVFAAFAAAVVALAVACSSSAFDAANGPSSGAAPDPDDDGARDAGRRPRVCTPGDVSTFQPAMKSLPPRTCSNEQIAGYARACFEGEDAGRSGACRAFVTDPANAACLACAATEASSGAWGLTIYVDAPARLSYPNVGGCLKALEPTAEECATKLDARTQCLLEACVANCYVPELEPWETADFSPERNALRTCFEGANGGGCAPYAREADACTAALGGSAQAAYTTCASLVLTDDVTLTPEMLAGFARALRGVCGVREGVGVGGSDAGDGSLPRDAGGDSDGDGGAGDAEGAG
jgi:hypothetical protein